MPGNHGWAFTPKFSCRSAIVLGKLADILARIPNIDWSRISANFPRTIADLLSDHNLANHPLGIIPNMDWAHISGLFPRTIADLLSNHNLANHPLAIIPTMDDGHIPDLETLSYGGAFAVAQIPGLPASQITSGQFPLSRMPRAASGLFLEGNGAADPIYNALIAANIPNLDTAKITTGTFPVARGGTGLSTIALGGILYASALNVLSRLAPTAANQVLRSTAANALQFAVLLAADIPNLDAGKITSGAFALARIPNMDWAHISGLFPRTIAAILSDHNLANHDLGTIVPHDALASLTEKAHSSLTGVTASQHHTKYTDTEAQNTVKANVEVGDLKAPTKALAMNNQKVTGLLAPTTTGDALRKGTRLTAAETLDGVNGALLKAAGAGLDPVYIFLNAADIPYLPASKITSERFPMARMPDGTLGQVLTAQGPGANPAYATAPGVPSGLIAMWHGTIANIPAGWVICDGNNSTPNLLAKFVEGVATAGTNPGATGGAVAKTTGYQQDWTVPGYATESQQTHTHKHAISDIRPPFYDLAFLMKT